MAKTRTVVFDLEIQKTIVTSAEKCTETELEAVRAGKAVHGWENAHKGGISSGVAYVMEEDRYHIYGDTYEDHERLAKLIIEADQVVGFNHINFDYPLLAHSTGRTAHELQCGGLGGAPRPGTRDVDLLQMIWGGLGSQTFRKGCNLDAVSLATLGAAIGGKNGNGELAPLLYQQGLFGKLLNYNIRDVDLTRRLFRFITEHGYCLTGDGTLVTPVHPVEWFQR
jgi:hypothetical protein